MTTEKLSSLFFITGRGRSGTWLLRSILNSHPKLCVTPEALFVMHLYQKYHHVQNWDKKSLENFYDDLILEERLTRWWQLDKNNLKKIILSQPKNINFSELCKLVYWQYSQEQEKEGVVYLGDKNPGYTLFMEKLLATFPKAKFIHMVRDPRDNVLSFQKADFDLNNTTALAIRWLSYNQKALQFIEQHPSICLLVRYEDLLSDSEATLRKICRFLGVDYTSDLLEFYKKPKNVFEWNKRIAEPLNPSMAYKWKTEMPDNQLETINFITKPLIEYFEYDYQEPSMNKIWLQMKNFPMRCWGHVANFLEVAIFSLPTNWRMFILNIYRRLTKSLDT